MDNNAVTVSLKALLQTAKDLRFFMEDAFEHCETDVAMGLIFNQVLEIFKEIGIGKKNIMESFVKRLEGRKVVIGDIAMYGGRNKYNRFDTVEILKLIGLTEKQIKYLPKNPDFHVGPVKELAKETGKELHWVDESNKIEIKDAPKDLLKGGK